MQGQIVVMPIGWVRGPRKGKTDDFWGDVESVIELDVARFGPDAVLGLAEFSHLEVVFHLHLVREDAVSTGTRHPRGRVDWPEVGIFAQRAKARPNRIGVSRCRLVRVEGTHIVVEGLDAIDGTPRFDYRLHRRPEGARHFPGSAL